MNKQEYIKRLNKHYKKFGLLWSEIVNDTNEYMEENETDGKGYELNNAIESLTDFMAISGAWLTDRNDGIIATTHNKDYKKSLTKKIRQALGYSI